MTQLSADKEQWPLQPWHPSCTLPLLWPPRAFPCRRLLPLLSSWLPKQQQYPGTSIPPHVPIFRGCKTFCRASVSKLSGQRGSPSSSFCHMEGELLQMSEDASMHPFHAQFCEGSFLWQFSRKSWMEL